MRPFTPLLAVAAVLALGACGGGDDGGDDGDGSPGSADAAATAPKPRASIPQASRELVSAIESGDCQELLDAANHSTKRAAKLSLSDAPPSKEECARLGRFARQNKGLRIDGRNQVFASGAVADGHIGRSPIATIFVLDLDGSWKTAITSGSLPQVGSKPAADNEFDANVARFVDAARDGDCPEVYRLLSTDSELVNGTTRERFCKSLSSRDPRSFFNRVNKDPDAKPVALGKTAEFAFYGLALKPGIYYTLFAARQPDKTPLTQAHERDAVYNWYLAKE